MTHTAFRRVALGAAPVMLIAGALAGCNNDGAPEVQAPPATSGASSDGSSNSAAEPTAPSTGQSTDEPVPTDTGVPTVSQAPSSSSATGDKSKVCTEQEDFLTPGVVAPSTKKAKWGKPLDLKQKYSGVVTVTPHKPKAKKPGSDDLFGPDEGQTNLLVKVDVKYKSGKSSLIAGIYFTLRDQKSNLCDFNSLTQAIPKQQQFDDATLSKTSKTYSGTLVFTVPEGQDYSKYTLLYRPGTYSEGSDASVAWTK